MSDTLLHSFKKLRTLLTRREMLGFFILLLGMIVAAVLEAASIGAIPVFIGLAMDPERVLQIEAAQPVLGLLGISSPRALVVGACVAMLLIFLGKTIYNCLLVYFRVRYTQNRQMRLTDRLFRAYMFAPYQFHLGRNSSELLRNTRHEVDAIVNGVIAPFLALIMHAMMTLGIVVLLVASEPLMAIVAVTLMGVAGFGYQWHTRRRIKAYGREAQRHRMLVVQTVQQGLGSLKEVRIMGRESHFVALLSRSLQRMMRADRFSKVVNAVTTPYMEFVAVGGLLAITIMLVTFGREVEAIAPTLGLFAAALVRLRTGVSGLVSSVTELRYKTVAIDPVHDDLKLLDETRRRRAPVAAPRDDAPLFMKELSLRGVWLRYPGAQRPSLEDVSLTIPRGRSVAFVGPTGAGKTTVVDVILGLLEPERGEVCVDGRDIRSFLGVWHRHLGYIPQYIYLTDDTIRRNVALGLDDPAINEDQVLTALAAAQLNEFISGLPDGLDTVVGERGVRLSGGQRQRIGIARALYHNPDVLVMDEATSALDSATEKSVIDAVNRLKGTRTIIMIAHRLSTVRDCDHLFAMRNGRIEKQGPYELIVDEADADRGMSRPSSSVLP